MKDVLSDIQDGTFAKNWLLEIKLELQTLMLLENEAAHQLEEVGEDSKMMSWTKQDRLLDS